MTNEHNGSLTEFQDSPPSGSSRSALSLPWWRAPERILAVSGAVGLRWFDRLSEEWVALVLLAALGAPLAKWMLDLYRRRNGTK